MPLRLARAPGRGSPEVRRRRPNMDCGEVNTDAEALEEQEAGRRHQVIEGGSGVCIS